MTPKRFRLIGLLAILVGLVIISPRILKEARAWRARDFARQAETAMGAGDRKMAQERLASAAHLAPSDTVVLRAVARYDFLQRDPRGIPVWIRLVERDRQSAVDWEGLLQAALQTGDKVLAVRALEGFRKAAPTEKLKAKRYECRVLQVWGKVGPAADTAEWLLARGDEDPAFALYARELMFQGNTRQREGALKWLWEKSSAPDQVGISALIVLARAKTLTPAEQDTLSSRLRNHPLAGWESRLLAEALDIARGPKNAEAAAWSKFARSQDDNNRIRTARWLVSAGKATYASGLVTADEARTRRDAIFTYIDILGAGQRWDELLAFLEDPPGFLPAMWCHAYQARAADKKGNVVMSDRYWTLAVSGARNDPRAGIQLANYAGALGWNKRAGDLCRTLAQTPGGEVEGLLGLVSLARRTGDAAAEKEALEALRAKAPRLFPAGAEVPSAGSVDVPDAAEMVPAGDGR